jgi:hypothetical protein
MKFSMSISIRDGVGATNYCDHHAYWVVSYMLTETKQMLESESKKHNQKKYKWKNVSSPRRERGVQFHKIANWGFGWTTTHPQWHHG